MGFLSRRRYEHVFGQGPDAAKILILGDRPGNEEMYRGTPFVGRTGEELDRKLWDIRLERDSIFLANLLLQPPQGKEITPQEIQRDEPELWRILDTHRFDLIVTLGATTTKYFLGPNASLEKNHAIAHTMRICTSCGRFYAHKPSSVETAEVYSYNRRLLEVDGSNQRGWIWPSVVRRQDAPSTQGSLRIISGADSTKTHGTPQTGDMQSGTILCESTAPSTEAAGSSCPGSCAESEVLQTGSRAGDSGLSYSQEATWPNEDSRIRVPGVPPFKSTKFVGTPQGPLQCCPSCGKIGKEIVVFPEYHLAAGFHTADLQPFIEYDWTVLGQYLKGTYQPPAEDMFKGVEHYELVASTTHRALSQTLEERPHLKPGVDTEGLLGSAWGLSISVGPGSALVYRKGKTPEAWFDELGKAQQCRTILLHNSLHDIPILRELGIEVEKFEDTMVKAFLLQVEPQGLKPLSFRHSGMEMAEYLDVVAPYAKEIYADYIFSASRLDWDLDTFKMVPVKRKKKDGSVVESLQKRRVFGIGSRLAKFALDIAKGKTTDIKKRWENIDEEITDKIVERMGPFPEAGLEHVLFGQGHWAGEVIQTARDGRRIQVWSRWTLRRGTGGAAEFLEINSDVSERKLLEEQLRQSQKMESVGQLAGGIAHDFNNLLTGILGYSDLLGQRLSGGTERREVAEIRKAGERAAKLTQQLLAFSRRQIMQLELLDLNIVVRDLAEMLQRLIGEDIDLAVRGGKNLGVVRADRGQIEQVLANLVVNARDAMPDGGKLIIETANADLDDSYAAAHLEAKSGPHVMLSVSDNGIGMDRDTLAHMFEPFFTTKGPGKGTGLGLATVYGIVKQSGGCVYVYSEPGQGATFKIYLPRVDKPAEPAPIAEPAAVEERGTETILVVEDEAAVRGLIRTVLVERGYDVLDASSGDEALRLVRAFGGHIDLLVTDVVLPQMSGRQLADRLAASRPGLRVLFMSGYTDNAIVHHGVLEASVAFLQKPFSPPALVRRIRELLDQPAAEQ